MKRLLFVIVLLSLSVLAAVAAPAGIETLSPLGGVKVGKISYVKSETARDPALEKAIMHAIDMHGTDVAYFYNRVALKGTRKNQVIVLMHGATMCGSGGCPAYIFDRVGSGYKQVAAFTLVHAPIIVLPTQHNGWSTLSWVVSGGGEKAHYARLDFNGRTYPSNPSTAPAVKAGTSISGTAYMADEIGPDSGIKLHLP